MNKGLDFGSEGDDLPAHNVETKKTTAEGSGEDRSRAGQERNQLNKIKKKGTDFSSWNHVQRLINGVYAADYLYVNRSVDAGRDIIFVDRYHRIIIRPSVFIAFSILWISLVAYITVR